MTGRVEAERLYQHVLQLEGIRHPIVAPERLNRAADYIAERLRRCGAEVTEHTFALDGFASEFRNVEGLINPGASGELLITAHYDTVRCSPGADDNASAVAVMLEAARVLAASPADRTVRFVGFTLEENHPVREARLIECGRSLGILDDEYRVTSLRTCRALDRHGELRRIARSDGHDPGEVWDRATHDAGELLGPAEHEYLEEMRSLFDVGGGGARVGTTVLVGSSAWAERAVAAGAVIDGVINLETVGFRRTDPHSQRLPGGTEAGVFPRHRVGEAADVGDFIAIVSDERSIPLGSGFFDRCIDPAIDLPALHLALPYDADGIASVMPDALRSDHASFWVRGLPAIMVTDTAEFRTPYYHTPGDTIDTLDFDFIRAVCEATVAMAAAWPPG